MISLNTKGIYSVYDKKAGIYLNPFVESSDGTAIRAMQDIVQNKEHPFARHASDFQLVKIGNFSDGSGEISKVDPEPLIEMSKLLGDK